MKKTILFLILNLINIAQSMSSCSEQNTSNLFEMCLEYNHSECLHEKSTQSECTPHLYDSIENGNYVDPDVKNYYTIEDYYHINMPDISSN